MCGIVGALDLRGQRDFPAPRLELMARALRHRGPDDFGAWSEPGIALATRRLSIIDVAGGRQPLCDSTQRVWVSYNGELFNAHELSAELTARGHKQSTRCDTELWPYLYLDFGQALFEHARGQFAVAIWDRSERRLLLGRDRVGICPLFYAIADGWLIWASEIKAILAAGILQRAVDVRGLDDLFSLFASGSRRTCFHGVQAICPGHYLEVRAGSVNERRYWDLAFPPAGEERQVENSELLVDELEAILQTAVSRRLIADAPRATYLSGGIDSALITAFARKSSAELLPAFTLGFDAEGEDERSRAEYTAQALGVPLTTLVPAAGELVDMLPAAVEAAESPILDMANTCLLKLSRSVAAHGAKVVLTGEGADEALGGYVWHKARRVLSMLDRAPLAVGRGLRSALAKLVTPHTRTPRLGVALAEFKPIQLEMHAPMARARSYFYSDALLEQVSEHDPLGELDVNLESMRSWHPLNQALYIDYKLMLPGHLLLGKGDRVGMRSSVENRYPFLDEAFINFAASLAPNYKLRGFSEKWLLRKLAQRVLPARIAQYPKTMFKAKSLCELGPAPRWMTQLMSSESLRATGYFAVERVRHEERLQALLPSLSPRRYVADASYSAVVTTQLWHHLYLGGGLCELPSWSPSG